MIATPAPLRRPPATDESIPLTTDLAMLESLQSVQRRYGNIVSLKNERARSAYFVNDPDAIRHILVRNHGSYVKGPDFQRVKMLLGNGLFVSDGATWRRSRTMVQPGFTRRNLQGLIGTIVRCCEAKAQHWQELARSGEPVNITKEMTDYALEVILRAIFGDDYDDKLIVGGENIFAFLSSDPARDLQLVLKFRKLRNQVLEIVEERRRKGLSDGRDFLAVYLAARDKDGNPYTDGELLDELMTLVVAGFETSAGTLNWAWYLIAGHAGVEERIFREARAVMPVGESVTSENVADLVYLRQVLDETMRLYPPGWLFSRRAIRDDAFEGYDVPAGTDIFISPYILHRTAEFWPQPDTFDPDRFAGAGSDEQAANRQAAYIPFSLGPRRCIGEYLAILEMAIHVGLLAQQFRMEAISDTAPELDLGINLRTKNDIFLRPVLRA